MTSDEKTPTGHDAAPKSGRALPRIVNNFIHDMSTGLWAACVLVIAVVSSRAAGVDVQAAKVLAETNRLVFWLLVSALVGLSVTGGIRLGYWRAETRKTDVATKRGALVAKHLAFLAIYGAGTVWAAMRVFAS